MSGWIDTHSHLADASFRNDPEGYLSRCRENNVRRIMAIAAGREELEYLLGIPNGDPAIDIALGYHPEDLREKSGADWEYLEKALADPRIRAVGEIGIDHHWDRSYDELQRSQFIRQIGLANKHGKPILVHARDADEETYGILRAHPPVFGCVLHCYSGSPEMAERYLSLGNIYFAFGGTLTYKNSVRPKESARRIPDEWILTETDSPFLAPEPFRGTVNESKNVRFVGEFLAGLRGVSAPALRETVRENYERLLGSNR